VGRSNIAGKGGKARGETGLSRSAPWKAGTSKESVDKLKNSR